MPKDTDYSSFAGKIPLPDLRIEYETREGEMARVDLELATEHYRGRNLAEKVRAGFSIYAHAQDAAGLRACLDQEELNRGDFVPMNLPTAHIERIKDLGYTDSEARFLYIVAVFSGYFTLGHFRAFTGSAYGKRPTSFAQKLLKQGHATVRDYMRRGSIYHLFSRTVYGQIEKDNLRNRKKHSFDFMRTRLVLLDFILANQELAYFETEQDKVIFFCEQLGVSKDFLPAKVYEGSSPTQPTIRYFVDKFPLFLASPVSGAPPVVTLSYVDSGFETPSHFVSHLAAYRGLFQQLKSFRFLYIAAKQAYFHKAEERLPLHGETALGIRCVERDSPVTSRFARSGTTTSM